MPTQDHLDLLAEIRRTRSVRASMLTLVNSIHQRMRVGLEANSGHGDLSALRSLCDDLSPVHRDHIADSLVHGTRVGAQDGDTDPTAPPPASNPASLGGNVYGSLGPEDTDTQRPGGPQDGARDLSPQEVQARERALADAQAREAADRQKSADVPAEPDPALQEFVKRHDAFEARPKPTNVHDKGYSETFKDEPAIRGKSKDQVDGGASKPAQQPMNTGVGETVQQDRPAAAAPTPKPSASPVSPPA